MVLTIGKIATFSEFLDTRILERLTETLEYILRVDDIIEKINNDEVLSTQFADAIGNLMD